MVNFKMKRNDAFTSQTKTPNKQKITGCASERL